MWRVALICTVLIALFLLFPYVGLIGPAEVMIFVLVVLFLGLMLVFWAWPKDRRHHH